MKPLSFMLLIAILISSCSARQDNAQKASELSQAKSTDSIETPNDAQAEPVAYATAASEEVTIPYDLENASAEYKLSGKLTEISGLSLNEDESKLLAVNDEQGKIFFLDKNNGEILDDKKFAKSGDYEGIEQVGNKVYVVNSSGSVFRVKNWDKKEADTKKYKTDLKSNNDVEGLGYDSKSNSLLIACKNRAGLSSGEYSGKRAVYAFDLEEKKLSKKPVLLIDQEEIKKKGKKERWWLDELMGVFSPSAIAIHPKTKDIYILSSVGKILVVLNAAGKVMKVEKLNKAEYRQPEGLCFAKDGTMYMSSEGKGGKARIYRFDMQ